MGFGQKCPRERDKGRNSMEAVSCSRVRAAAPVLFFIFVTTVVAAVDFLGAVLGRHHTKRLN